MAQPKYFEDQTPEVQAAQRAQRKAEIEAIGRMRFPLVAEFCGKPVTILGPVARFSPYKEQSKGPEDPYQLMIQPMSSQRFITFATGLRVDGKPLVTRLLPLRDKPDFFERIGKGREKPSVSTKPTRGPAPRLGLAA